MDQRKESKVKKEKTYLVTATHNGTEIKRTGTWEFKSADDAKAINTIAKIMREEGKHWPPGTHWESEKKKG